MIRPPPMTYRCPACHWSKTVARGSDVILPWERFNKCPKCGSENLESRLALSRDVILNPLWRKLYVEQFRRGSSLWP